MSLHAAFPPITDAGFNTNEKAAILFLDDSMNARPQTGPLPRYDADKDLSGLLHTISRLKEIHPELDIIMLVPDNLATWRDISPEEELILIETLTQYAAQTSMTVLRTGSTKSDEATQINSQDSRIWRPNNTQRSVYIVDGTHAQALGLAHKKGLLVEAIAQMSEKDTPEALLPRLGTRSHYPVLDVVIPSERPERPFSMPWQKTRHNRKKKRH